MDEKAGFFLSREIELGVISSIVSIELVLRLADLLHSLLHFLRIYDDFIFTVSFRTQ